MKHYSLFELNQEISAVLSAHLEPSYWIVAEISQVQVNQKGHCYLELVDKEGNSIKAKMRGTIWSYTYRNLITWFENMTRQSLKAGMEILFNAEVQYHEVYGISLNIRDIDANYTLGERARKRAETIEQLKEDGVFDMNRQLVLPLVPQRIAVISSATAAGFGDFQNQLNSNAHHYRFEIKLFNSMMQGNDAEKSIIASLHAIFEEVNKFDLVVIIRGGGASTDLDCFDSYELSAHVAQFPIPIITGIGHDRDETICDMVAHTGLKTPTAVSEFLISGARSFEDQLDNCLSEMYYKIKQVVSDESLALEKLLGRIYRGFKEHTARHRHQLDQLTSTLGSASTWLLESQSNHLDELKNQLASKSPKALSAHLQKLESIDKYLQAADPERIFKRGFSFTSINGKSIGRYQQEIKKGDVIETKTINYYLKSEIKEIKKTTRKNDKG